MQFHCFAEDENFFCWNWKKKKKSTIHFWLIQIKFSLTHILTNKFVRPSKFLLIRQKHFSGCIINRFFSDFFLKSLLFSHYLKTIRDIEIKHSQMYPKNSVILYTDFNVSYAAVFESIQCRPTAKIS